MALFGKNKEKKPYFSAATIITKGTTSIGNYIGEDSIHIDGCVEGDIKVNNVVVIGRDGVVNGNIKAEQVICSGTFHGDMICDSLEVMESAKVQSHIKTNKALIKGTFKGSVICSGLFVSHDALVEANVQAKNVVAGGTILGTIACLVLKIPKAGCVKGKMFANRIINQGGHVEGFIGKYADLIMTNPQLAHDAAILNSHQDKALLQHADYHVDVDKEIENSTNPSEEDEDFCIDVEFDIKDESKLKRAS